MAEFEVLSDEGVQYTHPDGGDVKKWIKGEKIRQADIDKRFISFGGLQGLEKRGIVKRLDDGIDNKVMPGASKKNSKKGTEDEE